MLVYGHGNEDHVEQPAAVAAPVSGPLGKDWVIEKTGTRIPLDGRFSDENGQSVHLADIIDKPTVLLPIYFYCPSACSTTLAVLANSLKQLKARPGQDFQVIALSFNEKETAADAARAKKNYLKLAGDSFPEQSWLFLTGDKGAIESLTSALGYRFQRVANGTYIHPEALVAVAGDGTIIRYVYGSFIPGDIDIAIADATKGTPSMSVRRLLKICFGTDPGANTAIVQNVKIAVLVVFVGAIAVFVLFSRRRNRRPEDAGDRTK